MQLCVLARQFDDLLVRRAARCPVPKSYEWNASLAAAECVGKGKRTERNLHSDIMMSLCYYFMVRRILQPSMRELQSSRCSAVNSYAGLKTDFGRLNSPDPTLGREGR